MIINAGLGDFSLDWYKAKHLLADAGILEIVAAVIQPMIDDVNKKSDYTLQVSRLINYV